MRLQNTPNRGVSFLRSAGSLTPLARFIFPSRSTGKLSRCHRVMPGTSASWE